MRLLCALPPAQPFMHSPDVAARPMDPITLGAHKYLRAAEHPAMMAHDQNFYDLSVCA